jgi:uncharacterized protein YfiM (DUF2279 family)
MTVSFNRVTDNVDVIYAADINKLQSAVEDLDSTVSGLSSINASFMLSAAGITPAATNGCADPETKTSTSNLVTYKVAAFDKDTVEIGWWNHPLPSDYDGGTITYKVYWEHPSTTTNFKVAWDLAAIAAGNDDAIDTAVGTVQQVNDEGGTTNDMYLTAASSALTIAGSPAAGDMVFWRLRRVANDGTNDTLAVDAWLIYVEITYTRA